MKLFQEQEVQLLFQYFSGTISERDAEKLEQKLADPNYLQEFNHYKALFKVIEKRGDQQLKDFLQQEEIHNYGASEVNSTQKSNRSFPRLWLAVAASLAILIFGYLNFWSPNQNPAYFTPYPVLGEIVNRQDLRLTDQQQAFFYYSKEKYSKALPYFQNIPNSPTIQFYTANCHLGIGQTEPSIPLYQGVINSPESIFSEPSKFYLGLAYFHNNQLDSALYWLNYIQNAEEISETYQNTATEIIKAIKRKD